MTTPTPSPEAEALPTLPVVAWRTRHRSEPGMIGHYPWSFTDRVRGMQLQQYEYEPLTSQAPAEAAIVALRAERDQALAEAKEIRARWNDAENEMHAEVAELRKERDEWRIRAAESELSLEDYKSSFWKAAELRDALRTALEIIGVGDSGNPQVDAADTLVELGIWNREAVDEIRAARASLLGDGGTL